MEEEFDQQEVSNLEEDQNSTSENESVDIGEIEARAKKAEEIAENQKIRAEKAERELKALKKAPKEDTEKNDGGMSLMDIRALQDVHDDDVEEVINFAKFKGVSVAEAKKNPVIQMLLKTKAEERNSAAVANTTPSRRGAKNTDEVILEKIAKQEDLSDSELKSGARALVEQMKKGQK